MTGAEPEEGHNRREFLKILGRAGGGAAVGFLARSAISPPLNVLDNHVAYGAGTNVKNMLDPSTGEAFIPLDEVFYFDLKTASCRIDNNPEAFSMDTHTLGRVTVDANTFFMLMPAGPS